MDEVRKKYENVCKIIIFFPANLPRVINGCVLIEIKRKGKRREEKRRKEMERKEKRRKGNRREVSKR